MEFSGIILASVLIVLVYYVYSKLFPKYRLPPGPIGLPGLGLLPFMILEGFLFSKQYMLYYERLCRYKKQFGPLTSCYFGEQLVVVINDWKLVKEYLVQPVFAGRPNTPFYKSLSGNGLGLVFTESHLWKVHRRFSMKVLKDFGVGKPLLEKSIQEEAFTLVNEIRQKNISEDLFTKPVANVITVLIFGQRLGYEDPQFESILNCVRNLTQIGGLLPFLGLFFPSLAPVLNVLPGNSIIRQNMENLHQYLNLMIKEHKSNFNPNNEPIDYIDAFLMEQHQLNLDSSTKNSFTDDQLLMAVTDLFAAGMDTTSNLLSWAMICLAQHVDWQEKLRSEINQKFSGNVFPTYQERRSFPLLLSFVDEVHRFHTVLPHSVDRRVMNDVVVNGFDIPATAILQINIHGIHRDADLWHEPEKFDPTRFLNENGNHKAVEYLIPFNYGQRSCLGEQLARMEIFIFMLAILKHFKVTLDSTSFSTIEDIYCGTDGIVHAPGKHKLILTDI